MRPIRRCFHLDRRRLHEEEGEVAVEIFVDQQEEEEEEDPEIIMISTIPITVADEDRRSSNSSVVIGAATSVAAVVVEVVVINNTRTKVKAGIGNKWPRRRLDSLVSFGVFLHLLIAAASVLLTIITRL
jgi:hypothetical protein